MGNPANYAGLLKNRLILTLKRARYEAMCPESETSCTRLNLWGENLAPVSQNGAHAWSLPMFQTSFSLAPEVDFILSQKLRAFAYFRSSAVGMSVQVMVVKSVILLVEGDSNPANQFNGQML